MMESVFASGRSILGLQDIGSNTGKASGNSIQEPPVQPPPLQKSFHENLVQIQYTTTGYVGKNVKDLIRK